MAAAVDSEEDAAQVAADLGFSVAHGVTRAMAEQIGAWWEERRNHIQPSEFVMTPAGRILASVYASSPVGRMDPEETLVLIRLLASRSG